MQHVVIDIVGDYETGVSPACAHLVCIVLCLQAVGMMKLSKLIGEREVCKCTAMLSHVDRA